MRSRSLVTALALTLVALTAASGCAAPTDADGADAPSATLASSVSEEVAPPGPLDRPIHPFETPDGLAPPFDLPVGDGDSDRVEPRMRERPFGGCSTKIQKLWDPIRGEAVEVAFIVCD